MSGDLHSGRVLAPGEELLWSGAPSVRGVVRHVFRLPILATYFGLIALWGLVQLSRGRASPDSILFPLAAGLATAAIVLGLAALVARTTRYRVTGERVILQYGVAFPRSLSLPFRQISSLSLSLRRDGRGDVALGLRAGNHMPFLKLWPHARGWHIGHPQPMLRDIPEAALVATRLSRVLCTAEQGRFGQPQGRPADAIAAGSHSCARSETAGPEGPRSSLSGAHRQSAT